MIITKDYASVINSKQVLRYKASLAKLSKLLIKLVTFPSLVVMLINQSYANGYTQIPSVVAAEMQKRNLTIDEISFIVTPLGTSSTNQLSNDKLPIADIKKNLQQQLEELLKKQSDFQLPQNLDTANKLTEQSLANLEKNTKELKNLRRQISLLESSSDVLPLMTSYQHLPNRQRTPASTMKLIPTFVGLDILGKDFVWTTKVYHTGYRVNNTLHGDLIIKGSGDPKFTHQKLEALLAKVTEVGITNVEGNIIIDSSVFHNVTKDPAKFDNDPLRPYNASPDGFLVNFSTMTIDSYPLKRTRGVAKSQLVYTPSLKDIKLPQQVSHRKARCQSTKRSLRPVWKNEALIFNASLPNGCGRHSFYIAYPDAKNFAQQVTKAKWLGMGNSLTGEVLDSRQIINANISFKKSQQRQISPFAIASLFSYSLSEQIYDINHYSNNVMTEQLLLSIPVYQNNQRLSISDKQVSDYSLALDAVDNWWQANLSSSPPRMTNGSGLCRSCTVTVNGLNEMLGRAYQHKDFMSYVNSLGVAGMSGTIAPHKRRRPDSAAIGRAWIKTGTLNNVTAMAGYIKGKSGQEYSVVAIINLPKGKRGANSKRPVLDSLIEWVAEH